MKVLNDFECSDNHVTEQFVNSEITESTCTYCGKPATRRLCAPRIRLEGITGHFPGAAIRWENTRKKRMQFEQKAIDNHGPDASWDVARRY